MAWRIEHNVVRGDIDNQMRGRIEGRIWLAGCSDPLVRVLDDLVEVEGSEIFDPMPKLQNVQSASPLHHIHTTIQKPGLADLPTAAFKNHGESCAKLWW